MENSSQQLQDFTVDANVVKPPETNLAPLEENPWEVNNLRDGFGTDIMQAFNVSEGGDSVATYEDHDHLALAPANDAFASNEGELDSRLAS
ncbi:hypothetical protein IPG41_04880 [Candidatus Peregrinibacteria bacterium]|nr:MAG: hypothetical protein IPG41_04880 [Candidatus Peregrinibacteria bacterium]